MNVQPIDPASSIVPSLAAVASIIRDMPAIEDRRRRDILSAVERYCEWVRLAPSAVPCNVRAITRRFRNLHPAVLGVSPKTIANVKSALFLGLEIAGLPVHRAVRVPRTPAWAEVERIWHSSGEPAPYFASLHSLVAWCCRRGVRPAEVTDAVLARFAQDITEQAPRRCNTIARNVATKWNKAATQFPQLGLGRLEVPDQARRYRRRHLGQLPLAFLADLDRYCEWLACNDPFAEDARSRPLKPTTVEVTRQTILTAADLALYAGIEPMRLAAGLKVLIEEEVVKAVFRKLLERSNKRASASTERTKKVLIGIAREWGAVSAERLTELKALLRRVDPLAPGMTDKNAALLRQFEDPVLLDRLLALPQVLFRRGVQRLADQPDLALSDLQAAIGLEILLFHSLRRANLCALRLSVHFTWPANSAAPTLLHLASEEVKNGRAITKEVGADLGAMLDRYRRELLPRLVPGGSDHLFCRLDGSRRSAEGTCKMISAAIRRELGIEMTLHQFRHLTATLILDANPGAYELAKEHLGHRNSSTTALYYAGQRGQQASRAFGALIEQRRHDAGPPKRGRVGRGRGGLKR